MTKGIYKPKPGSTFKIAIGVMVAPRQIETVGKTIESLIGAGFDLSQITAFCEPGEYAFGNHIPVDVVKRPRSYAPIEVVVPSPEGHFGNFQNFVQTLRDLIWIAKRHSFDAVMIVEDDAIFAKNIKSLIANQIMATGCGLLSLYTPEIRGFFDTDDLGCHPVARRAFFGGLAMVMPLRAAAATAYNPSVSAWTGSRKQSGVQWWERNASDSWIGQMMRDRNYSIYAYNPSLVGHYCPESLLATGNSSRGVAGRPHIGTRQAKNFIGEQADALEFFKNNR